MPGKLILNSFVRSYVLWEHVLNDDDDDDGDGDDVESAFRGGGL